MEYFFILSGMAAIYVLLKIMQLHFFSKHMDREIEELYDSSRWPTQNINFDASYHKLRRSMPWNYSFADMVVYETR
jgi:hypothetical protein